jgi:hypothetical protein
MTTGEVISLIKAFGGSGGGGSSGGGVLVVGGTPSGDEIVLDKTCKEIWDAMKSGGVVIDAGNQLYPVMQASKGTIEYSFYINGGIVFIGRGDDGFPVWSDK